MHLFQNPGKPCKIAVGCRSDLRAGGGSSVWTVTCCSCEQISPKAAEPRSENRPSIQTHSALLLLSQPGKTSMFMCSTCEQSVCQKTSWHMDCLGSFKTCKETVYNIYFRSLLKNFFSYQTENMCVYKISVMLNWKTAEAEGQLISAHFMMFVHHVSQTLRPDSPR